MSFALPGAALRKGFVALSMTLLLGTAFTVRADETDPAKKHGPIQWLSSLDKAKKRAAKEKKIIFVDFYADWCGSCKEMLKTTYQDKKVVAASKKLIPVLLNVDKNLPVAEKYEVEGIPRLIFMDAKGKSLVSAVGLVSPDDFLKLMQQASKKAK